VSWIEAGAGRDEYERLIRPVLAGHCIGCHRSRIDLMAVNGPSDLTSDATVQKVANVNAAALLGAGLCAQLLIALYQLWFPWSVSKEEDVRD
jgi:hypothetical protein